MVVPHSNNNNMVWHYNIRNEDIGELNRGRGINSNIYGYTDTRIGLLYFTSAWVPALDWMRLL